LFRSPLKDALFAPMKLFFHLEAFRYQSKQSKRYYHCFKVRFPYKHAALKAYLEKAGMRYTPLSGYYYMVVPDNIDPEKFGQQLKHKVRAFYRASGKEESHGADPSNIAASGSGSAPGERGNNSPVRENRFKQVPFAIILERLSPAQHEILGRYLQMLALKRYSSNTIQIYRSAFVYFLAWCGQRMPLDLSNQDVLDYMARCIEHGGISESYQNIIINAIKFYYEKVEGKQRTVYVIPRPKRYEPLPKVLDKEEIRKMILGTLNLKHRCLLLLLYGSGLRLGEVLNLLPSDVDRARGVLHIKRAKGKKDRMVPIHPALIDLMAKQMREGQHLTWIFEGSNPGERYSDRSLQNVVKQAAKRAGINRPVTAHMLRHSYATHLMEDGIDLRIIQTNLGHSSIKTTEIYTHVARQKKPRSPLDDILGEVNG